MDEDDDVDELLGDFPYCFADDVALIVAGGELSSSNHMIWGQSLGYLELDTVLYDFRPTRRGYERENETWINLLQVPSFGKMMWSDVGFLAFLIRETDLQQGNFHSVVAEVLST